MSSLEHDTVQGRYNSLIQIDADTFALAYAGTDFNGFLTTFDISADGTTITKVSSLEHDTVQGSDNSLVHVDGDTYALAYTGPALDGFISTFTISADGTTITKVSTLEHDITYGFHNSLVQVDANTFALAYTGSNGYTGFISTFTISADGTTITKVSTLEHGTVFSGYSTSLVQIDDDTYALAYHNNASFISTFDISADGTIITKVSTLKHDGAQGVHNSLVKADDGTFVLAYGDYRAYGNISTFDISADGTTITEMSSLALAPIKGAFNSLVQMDADTYVLAYSGSLYHGQISTFDISADCPIP